MNFNILESTGELEDFYVDGACSKNGYEGSSGGFGVVGVLNGKVAFAHAEQEAPTTNNREELKAILYVVQHFGPYARTIYSDSAYAINTYTNWMWNWERNGWVKSNGATPENLDIIKEYYNLVTKYNYNINFCKVKGHSNNKYNELADGLATGRLKPEEILDI